MNESLRLEHQPIDIRYTTITSLPKISPGNISQLINKIESQGKPKDIQEILNQWNILISSNMKYDAMNYSLMKVFPLEELQDSWIDKVDISDISMTQNQIHLAIGMITKYRNIKEIDHLTKTDLDLMIFALKNRNFIEFTKIMVNYPSLQNYILSDQEFGLKWMKEYENKSIDELYRLGVGNCKTIGMMFVRMVENINTRWKLGVTKIDIIETDDYHIMVSISTKNGDILFDPMQGIYKKTIKQ